jgi:hypothetical protein
MVTPDEAVCAKMITISALLKQQDGNRDESGNTDGFRTNRKSTDRAAAAHHQAEQAEQ